MKLLDRTNVHTVDGRWIYAKTKAVINKITVMFLLFLVTCGRSCID